MEDGRGESIWDRFTHTAGNTAGGDTGDLACDHYHRMKEDVALMKNLGLKAYRFSISWPRIIPQGAGSVNKRGIDFYSRLVDELLAAGIEPWATLYHFDLPQALQDHGGFANRDTADAFAAYADAVAWQLGDRVKHWVTVNEPAVAALAGHKIGVHAPGLKSEKTALSVAHNLMLAHGQAVQAVRGRASGAKVGIVLNLAPVEPETQAAHDYIMAERRWQEDGQWFLHPLLLGRYPEVLFHQYGKNAPAVLPTDMRTISQPMDFLGVNYHYRVLVGGNGVVPNVPGSQYTYSSYEIHPQSLRGLLTRLTHDYRRLPAIYITANGAAFKDSVQPDGRIPDQKRLAFVRDHLHQAHIAMQQGVNLKGYFAWSLFDSFEWASGYSSRSGLVHVDYNTQQRRLKDSANWYQSMIADGGFVVDEKDEAAYAPVDFEPARATYALRAGFPVM